MKRPDPIKVNLTGDVEDPNSSPDSCGSFNQEELWQAGELVTQIFENEDKLVNCSIHQIIQDEGKEGKIKKR